MLHPIYILEFLFSLFFLIFVITQIAWPLWADTPLFPWFRKTKPKPKEETKPDKKPDRFVRYKK